MANTCCLWVCQAADMFMKVSLSLYRHRLYTYIGYSYTCICESYGEIVHHPAERCVCVVLCTYTKSHSWLELNFSFPHIVVEKLNFYWGQGSTLEKACLGSHVSHLSVLSISSEPLFLRFQLWTHCLSGLRLSTMWPFSPFTCASAHDLVLKKGWAPISASSHSHSDNEVFSVNNSTGHGQNQELTEDTEL